MTRRVVTLLALAVMALAGAAPADALAQDNSAVAINERDDSSVIDLAFSVKQVGGEVVDQTNSAVAYSSCERCQTVAIAIQVLIVMTENPDTVVPQNIAVAVNEECSSCMTMALAYQLVVGTGGPVELTPRGRKEIARIRRDLKRLERSGLSPLEIRDRTAALVDELRGVLSRELVPVRRGRDDDPDGGRGPDDRTLSEGDEDRGVEPGEPEPPEPPPESTTPTETTPTTTTPPPATAPEEQPTAPEETTPAEPPPTDDGATTTTP